MGLLGDSFDDPKSAAIMALAGGLLQGNFGGGLLGANNAYSESKQAALKQKLSDAQMRNYDSEIEARKLKTIQDQRQQQLIESMFPGMMSPSGPQQQPQEPQGLLGGGQPQAAPMPAPGGGAPQQGGGNILALSQQLGIPPEAIKTDMVFNGGKGIADMLYKRGTPDMQVTNGYAYDKNRQGAGYMPQLNISQDGKASMVQIGPDGMPVVSAPNGAYNTFGGYQNIQEGTKANFDPVTVTPQGENPQMTTRGALVRNPQVQGVKVPPDVQAARETDRAAILQQELNKAQQQLNAAINKGDQSAAARAQADIAALSREMGGRRPSIGMPLQSDEEKLRSTEGVKADATRNVALTGETQKSKDTLANITAARELLRKNPTSSGLGAAVDATANFFGKSTQGADVAAQLDTLSGWMVNNVPRMEGPQSNFDVQNYKTMAGLVGDKSRPISQRMKALETLEGLQSKYAHLNSGSNVVNSGGGATGSWGEPTASKPPVPMKGMTRNGYRFKGGDPSSPNSWEKM